MERKTQIQKIQVYLDTFEVGDLVCWRDRLHVLVEKKPIEDGGMWRLLDPTTNTMGNMYVRNWMVFSDCTNIREIIYKWTHPYDGLEYIASPHPYGDNNGT